MAEQILRDQTCWMDGYALAGIMNSMGLDYGADVLDVTAFGDTSRNRVGGLKTVAAALDGMFDANGTLDAALFNEIGVSDKPISFAMTGAGEGDTAYSFLAVGASYAPGGSVGDILKFSMQAEGNGDLVRGTLMHQSARTATGVGTGRQLGAIAAGKKIHAALHVIAASGTTPTLDLIVESDDNSGFTTALTRLTFAQKTAIGSEWLTLAGPITDDWWRLSWTIGGAGPSFTFIVVLAIQ